MSIAYSNYKGTDSVGLSAIQQTAFPTINLHVAAKNLTDMDVLTVSDPICVIYIWENGRWREFARTEVVWNNLNPEWVKFFSVMYVFEIRQPLLFRVYDVDSEDQDLSKQDFIGEIQVELSQIVSNTETSRFVLRNPKYSKDRGELYITPEQAENTASIVEGQFTAFNLKKMNFFSSNDPFFVIYKSTEGGRFVPVFQSEVDRKMRYKVFHVPMQILCNADPDRPIRVSFFDYHSNKAAKLIGQYDTTFGRLSEGIGQKFDLRDSSNKVVGQFRVDRLMIQQKFSFFDFLRGGLQINLITAIDFTASNGDPRDSRSLHYIAADGINQYEKCIRSVGEVLCPYDSDQNFPVFGFGAKIGGVINHCFPLTFNPQNPNVQGLNNIIGAYRNALCQVQLSGPTLFAGIIRAASQIAMASYQQTRTYTILLIITDGIINDMPDTKDAIVDAGRVPLSIIIVGVGNADFSAMDELDADDVPLVSRSGKKMERDLVQFVPYNKFANMHYSAIAQAVLEEVPRQLIEWAELNGVRPFN
jgi:hypothetical protein